MMSSGDVLALNSFGCDDDRYVEAYKPPLLWCVVYHHAQHLIFTGSDVLTKMLSSRSREWLARAIDSV